MILGKINAQYDLEDIEYIGEIGDGDGRDSLYDIILSNAKGKGIMLVGGCMGYTHDILVNYRDGEISLPVFKNETVEENGVSVSYNNRIEKLIIHDMKKGFMLDDFWLLPNVMLPRAKRVSTKGLRLSRELGGEQDGDAENLFNRYIQQSYGYTESDIDVFDYTIVKKMYLKHGQRKLLKDKGLDFYGAYVNLDYRDVRQWKLEELLEMGFTEKELSVGEAYDNKRLRFELELYTRLHDRKFWETGWSRGTMNDLLSGRRDFLKFKRERAYLIFKRRWL